MKKKHDKLNLRERKLIKALTDPNTKSQAEAMRIAGYSKSTIDKVSAKVVGKHRVQEAIRDIMERRGLTDERLLDVLDEGLKSDKVISANIVAQDGEGMADAHSMTKDFIEVPDYPTRHKYLDTALKLKGHMVDKKELSGPNGAPLTPVTVKLVVVRCPEDENAGS